MAILVNPYGRFVVLDDEKEVEHWLGQSGFRLATKKEATEYLNKRAGIAEQVKDQRPEAKSGKDVFLATVSQGGKDGYGIASMRLIDELRRLGINVQTHYNNQKVAILFHNPYSIDNIESPYRIIYTMFESDKIPSDWPEYLNAADEVIVPSKWCADVFKKSGVNAKVVPLGYDDNIFKFKERENKAEEHKPFTFLHYNAFNLRKGFVELFKAFVKEFDPSEPVRMIFKTTLDHLPLPITKEKYPNIEIITGKTSEEELANICKRADAFVFPSRGEGFGMTPLEAMATGLPTIVPNAHGITEYFNTDYMYEVKVKEMTPATYSRYKNQDVGKMVLCDVNDLAAKMRYIYEHQKEAMEKGRRAAEYVKTWTYKKTAEQLRDIIETALAKNIKDEQPLRNILRLEQI